MITKVQLLSLMGKYDDIINLPHHVSNTRKPMSLENRAAQFAPFAALSGHSEAISETARQTDSRINLSDEDFRLLSLKLNFLLENHGNRHMASFTYFVPYDMKDGGKYVTARGVIKKYDEQTHSITLHDGKIIPLHNILRIDIVKESNQ